MAARRLILLFIAGCSSTSSSTTPPIADAGTDAAIDSGTTPPPTASFAITDYASANGKYFLVTVTVAGTPFDVLLDTGSSGLRVFSATALGTPTGESVPTTFGGGTTLTGPTETAIVSFGSVTTGTPIAIQRVESGQDDLASKGIQGIMGVSLRADTPADIYSPFSQLPSPLGDAFVIRSGGYASKTGTITFGPLSDASGFQSIALDKDTRRSGAWNDAPSTCFTIAGVKTTPACSPVYFDTGANYAIVYDTVHPDNTTLAAGTLFDAKTDAFDFSFTIGAPPTTSLDDVHTQSTREGYSNLGVEFFFRYDVFYDVANGRIAFHVQTP